MNAETRDSVAGHPNAGSENCLAIGTRLSDFEITGVLGEGGFGIVYVAYDHALQRTVAIKEYMPGALAMRAAEGGVALRSERHQETFQRGLKSFINEARLLAQFDHPALIKVYRFWEQNNTAYTAMKFYAGRTVKDIVVNSPELVDEAWCRKMLGQILQALEMLYTMQILHRDISPDNIIVQDNGDAVLLDFGSARQIIGDSTRGLTVILKPGYAPVEQYAGDASLEQGPFTDLYALSAVMYFAITKAPPPTSIGRMVNDGMLALTKQAPAGYGERLLAAIDKGLAVLAQDRPQTIGEFRELLGIASDGPPPARPMAPPAPPAPAPAAQATAGESAATRQPTPKTKTKRAAPAGESAATRQPSSKPRRAAPAPAPAAAGAPNWGRLLIGAGAAGLLVVAVAGLYALVRPSGHDTVMPAQPQAHAPVVAAPAPSAAVAASAPAPAPVDDVSVASVPGAAAETPAARTAPEDPLPAPEAKPAPPPAGASYKLQIKPWGTVYVDDVARGVSPPLKQVVLTPGRHTIRVVNPSFPEHVATIEVDKTRPGVIAHDFSAVHP